MGGWRYEWADELDSDVRRILIEEISERAQQMT